MTDKGMRTLRITDHSRDVAGMTYVYPVLSRRAGGVSIGINLNPNNACNWHCAYCQVPGLVRGAAPAIDVAQLRAELAGFLHALTLGDYLERHVPEGLRDIRDIAFSGNGEPTSAHGFEKIVREVVAVRDDAGLAHVPIRLITNGSLLGREAVRRGIAALAEAGGEVWFKVDAGSTDDMARINGVRMSPSKVARNLATCARICPTWVQTCLFEWDGVPPDDRQISAYLACLEAAGIERLQGVLLYGVARQSMQPEAARIGALAPGELERYGERIKQKGLTVRVSP
jgi:wyosine [tRNA(Phe)-imidazoG37] synthetase (radical SAM superfamily)